MHTDPNASQSTLRDDLRALLACPRELWLIFLATFLEYMGIFSFLPTLAMWLSSDYAMGDKEAGWWASTFSMLLTFFVFIVGSIADAAGIRRTLIISFSLAAVTRLAMALAPSPAMAIASLLCFGFAYATTTPVLQAAVQRASNKRTRAFAFSLWYVSFNLAGALCGPFIIDATRARFLASWPDVPTFVPALLHPVAWPALPSWLYDTTRASSLVMLGKSLVTHAVDVPVLGPRPMSANAVIMAWGFVFAVLAALVILLLRKDFEHRIDAEDGAQSAKKTNPIAAMREVFTDKTFYRFLLLLAFLSLVKMMFQHMHFTWPKYITREQGDDFPVGAVWSLNSLLIIGMAPLGTALTRKMKPFYVLLVGAFISALSPFVLTLGSTMPFQIAMILVLTIGEALWSPRSYEYTLSIAPRGRESTYVALAALPFFFAKFLVGPTSGYLLEMWCPAQGVHHVAFIWLAIGLMTMLGPLGMFMCRNWIQRMEHAKATAA